MNPAPVSLHRWIWLLPILLLATLIGAQGLDADVIWYDELSSIGNAGGLSGSFSILDVLTDVQQKAPKHGPLFFEMLAGWGALVGWHHASLRTMSLFFGLITLTWIYRISRDAVDWRLGIWASAFLGLNVFWLEYWHDIRMYTLQSALLTALLWHYLHVIRPRSRVRRHHWVGLIVAATLSLYTQPYSIFVCLAIGIYHLLFLPKKERWLKVALSFLAVAILYLPWLPVTYFGLTTRFDTGGDKAMPLVQALEVFLRLFSNGNWILLLILLVAAALQLRKRGYWRRVRPFWVLATVLLLLLLSVNEAIGLLLLRRARYFFVSWYLWAIVIASGLAWIKPRWIAPVIMVIYLGSGFALRDAEDYKEFQGTVKAVDNYPPMHEYITALSGVTAEHDFVLGFSSSNFVNRLGMHGKSTADYYMEMQLGIDGAFVPIHFAAERLENDIPTKLVNHPFLLFTYNPQEKPAVFEQSKAIIERDYVPCRVLLDRPQLLVQRYVYHTLECERAYQPIHYEHGITVVDKFADVLPERDVVRVVTGWEISDEAVLHQYNVSIQILTADWKNVGQQDRHLYNDVLKWYVVELSTAKLMPGDYRVVVIIYDKETNVKISGIDATSGESGTILPIKTFTIER